MSRKIRWRNKGGPLYFSRNDRKGSGEVFYARPEDIPQAFRDTVEPLEEIQQVQASEQSPAGSQSPEEERKQPATTEEGNSPGPSAGRYTMQERGGGWYDVIDSETGKKVNEQAMREDVAKQLLEDLGEEGQGQGQGQDQPQNGQGQGQDQPQDGGDE